MGGRPFDSHYRSGQRRVQSPPSSPRLFRHNSLLCAFDDGRHLDANDEVAVGEIW